MTQTETRLLSKEDAKSFVGNMRQWQGTGKITWKKVGKDTYAVTANKGTWSQWCGK